MRRLISFSFVSIALAFAAFGDAYAQQAQPRYVFAVVVSRHGVRSISKAPTNYTWADWNPVRRSFLTARGYSLATYMGEFYRVYFGARGLSVRCVQPNAYIYADIDQRTLETAQALVQGMCGNPKAIDVVHNADVSGATADPLFDATAWAASQRRIDVAKSRAAVLAALPSPVSAIVSKHATQFSAMQHLLDARCSAACEPVTAAPTAITDKEGLAEVGGPLKTASTYAEDLFLEYAQCRPGTSDSVTAAMPLHVLAYDVNARNAYNPLVRGGTLFAHIVAMLEAKAGLPHGEVAIPDLAHDDLAFFVGHDTQLGALGGILDAHWPLRGGMVPDDMPPGGALMFELFKTGTEYRVRLRFAYETMEQYRHYKLVPGGIDSVPVSFLGCGGNACSVPLSRLSSLARTIAGQGFVRSEWTQDSREAVPLDPLVNPKWTQCKP